MTSDLSPESIVSRHRELRQEEDSGQIRIAPCIVIVAAAFAIVADLGRVSFSGTGSCLCPIRLRKLPPDNLAKAPFPNSLPARFRTQSEF